jgi:DNA-binding NarL/FixJ family response regulator
MSASKTAGKKARQKILIIDDHPMMREGLGQLIHNEPDMIVCGEAGDAREGLEKIQLLQPDLVIADITLPGKSGLELIKDVHAMHPDLCVLVISMHDESFYAERVLRAGGRGYIMKQEGGKKLMEGIRAVLEGRVYVSEKMSAKILDLFSGGPPKAATSPIGNLTDREFEVFQLIGRGLNTAQMAEQLHVSPKTIEVHRVHLKTKLKIKNVQELIRYAVRWQESGGAAPDKPEVS